MTSFISPYKADRQTARELHEQAPDGETPLPFIEVYVDISVEEAEKRDPKGLYQKARQGIIKEFTGIDSPYEAPEKPELVVNTAENDIEACVKQLIAAIV